MTAVVSGRLVLFFHLWRSLKRWDDAGLFDREVALYRALRPKLRSLSFVTYGDSQEGQYANLLDGIQIVSNRWRLPWRAYFLLLTHVYPMLWSGPTVVKSYQVNGADIALSAARRSGKKFIARCGYLWSDFREYRFGADSSAARQAYAIEQKVFPAADRVVVTTPAMRDTVTRRYQVPPQRVAIVPNYVQTDLFRPDHDSRRPRRVCFVGRLERQKNLFPLLEAVEGLDVELLMVGEGEQRHDLEAEVGTRGISVRFLGSIPHTRLPEVLNSAEAFILPSHYEGHPRALLEAMSCGLPVIGTDVPGIRDLLRHRETGYVCGTSPAEIRSAIQEVLGDAELRARMGRNAREYVVEHCSFEQVVQMELALLEQVLSE